MPKTRIAIDIDDVIADSTEALRLLVNERANVNISRDAYRTPGSYHRYYERIWERHGLQDRINFADISAEMTIDQSHVPPVEGSLAALDALGKEYQIIAITARDVSWETATLRWLKSHDLLKDIEVYFAGNHHAEVYTTKGELCRELNVDVLIDDNPDHCQSALDVGIGAILFGEYGWHADIPKDAIHCRDWPSVIECLYAKRSI